MTIKGYQRTPLSGKNLQGGLNDTAMPSLRGINEFKTLENVDFVFPSGFKKCKGRSLVDESLASEITGILCPPKDNPLVTLTATTNAIYFKVDSSYYTASVAAGSYYEQSDLATAIQTAMNAVYAGFTISYSATTRKFTFTHASKDFTLCALHASTTFPVAKIGFWESKASSTLSLTSTFAVDPAPAYNRFVSTADGKFYKVSTAGTTLTEVKLPSGTALEASADKWAGHWHNGRWYGSNGEEVYTLRHNTSIRKMLDNDNVGVSRCDAEIVVPAWYTEATKDTYSELSSSTKYLRVKLKLTRSQLGSTPADVGTVYVIDKLTFEAAAAGSLNEEVGLNIYFENAALGYRKLITYVSGNDFATYTSNGIPEVFIVGTIPTDGYETYLLFEFVAVKEGTTETVRIKADADTGTSGDSGHIYTMNSDGVFAEYLNGSNYLFAYGTCRPCEALSASVSQGNYFKASGVNGEGFETELDSNNSFAAVNGKTNLCVINIDDLDQDLKYARVYCTKIKTTASFYLIPPSHGGTLAEKEIGDVYYKVCDIPIEFFAGAAQLVLHTGLTDTELETYGLEADTTTVRSAPPAFNICRYWLDRLWVATGDDDVVYYSYPNEPEHFDLSNQYADFGIDNQVITALSPQDDRLLVFKKSQPYYITPSGSAFSVPQEYSPKGIGTVSPWSVVSARTEAGWLTFFQGANGHFYVSDGVELTCISEGRLETFVAGVSQAQLAKTVGYFDALKQDLVWMVPTGSATTPDKCVIYNLKTKAWRTKTMIACCVTSDWRNTSYVNRELYLGGGSTGKLFYLDFADADLSASITSTIESADLNFTEDFGIQKAFLFAWLKATGATAAQALTLLWYIDESTTASFTGGVTLTPGTTACEKSTSLNGFGKRFRYKLTNADVLGVWYIEYLLFDWEAVGYW